MNASDPEALAVVESKMTSIFDDHFASIIANPISRGHNIASDIGFPCDRYQVLCRVQGESRPRVPLALRKTFEVGKIFERPLIRLLQDAGFDVRATEDRRFE